MGYIISLSSLAIITIILGFYFTKNTTKAKRFAKSIFGGNIAIFAVIIIFALISFFPTSAYAQTIGTTNDSANVTNDSTNDIGLGLMAAALSTGLAAIGAGIGVAVVGSASVGAISEKPELLGSTLIYVGLAEGIVIYGLIISIMILGRI
ncbi:ATPase [Petrotoga sp. 9PWA.NaAc.5.4]|nr:ATPase [Petrotoga sp. 9PWA.NaAc.5.4]